MFTFKHPKYYKELRERNKLDQAISGANSTEQVERAPDPGQPGSGTKQQAPSSKQQAPSGKPEKNI